MNERRAGRIRWRRKGNTRRIEIPENSDLRGRVRLACANGPGDYPIPEGPKIRKLTSSAGTGTEGKYS